MIRAVTWETAHKDIEQQKSKKVVALKFKITGVSYDKNRDNRGYFRDDAPPEIKALAKNLYDRTNPLWDKAMQYVNEPEFVYKIKQVSVQHGVQPRRAADGRERPRLTPNVSPREARTLGRE